LRAQRSRDDPEKPGAFPNSELRAAKTPKRCHAGSLIATALLSEAGVRPTSKSGRSIAGRTLWWCFVEACDLALTPPKVTFRFQDNGGFIQASPVNGRSKLETFFVLEVVRAVCGDEFV
jgi:hypothetical protein